MVKCAWYLNISKEEYLLLYKGTSLEAKTYLFETTPSNNNEFIESYLTSKLWRLNNLYNIVDKKGNLIVLVLNRSQHIIYSESIRHPRLIILKSRQQGISTLKLIDYLDDCLFEDNERAGLIAQDNEATMAMLKNISIAIDNFSEEILNFLGIEVLVNNSKETSFSNGSNIRVRSSFRSTTLTKLHISELGKIANKTPEKAKELNSGTLQTIAEGNSCTIESTAEGTDNMFAKKWDTSVDQLSRGTLSPMMFKPIFLSWLNDPDCNSSVFVNPNKLDLAYVALVNKRTGTKLTTEQINWLCVKREELGDDFDREYPFDAQSAFSQARDGTYYNKQMSKLRKEDRLVDDAYVKGEDVYVSFDLGINDEFVMLFWQFLTQYGEEGYEVRLIDEYSNSGEALKHYVGILESKAVTKSYKYKRFILPHDAKKRELGSGKSLSEQLFSLGLRKQTVLARTSILEGIQSSRAMFTYLIIGRDCTKCIKALDNYTKDWDKKLGAWKDKPLHDEHSNPADAFRYFGVYVELLRRLIKKPKKKKKETNIVDGLAL